jgi:predicted enzyme related to lactoylglutathione lyase
MFKDSQAFSSYSVPDVASVKDFYANTLGLQVEEFQEQEMDMLQLNLATGGKVMIYPKGEGHQAANFTVLNFPVADVDAAVDELTAKGVQLEIYDGMGQDEKGIARGNGPSIAWFKDPAGNVISVLSEV